MLIFQRYLLRELTPPIILSIIFFTFIMLLRQLFDMAELLLEARVGWGIFLELVSIITVSLVIITIPMAVLLGVLIGIGRLTTENEILAMRVSGASPTRLFYPLFVAGIIGAAGLMYSGFYTVPAIIQRLVNKQAEIQFEMLTKLEPGRNYDNLAPPGTDVYLYFGEKLEPEPDDGPYTLRMGQVAMRVVGGKEGLSSQGMAEELPRQDSEPEKGEPAASSPSEPEPEFYWETGEQETLFFASQGILRGNLGDYTLNIRLEDGTINPLNRMIYQRDTKDDTRTPVWREDPESHTSLTFDSMEKSLRQRRPNDRPEDIEPRLLSINELFELTGEEPEVPVWRDGDQGRLNAPWTGYLAAQNELYQRFTLPLALPAFILIAVPLALELRVRAKSISFLIAMLLILVYYVMFSWAAALGMNNSPFTLLAYMLPNILIGGIGLLMMWRVERQ